MDDSAIGNYMFCASSPGGEPVKYTRDAMVLSVPKADIDKWGCRTLVEVEVHNAEGFVVRVQARIMEVHKDPTADFVLGQGPAVRLGIKGDDVVTVTVIGPAGVGTASRGSK